MALVELETRKPEFTLITQNVDGLHELAGSKNVLKLHGDIWQVRLYPVRSCVGRPPPFVAGDSAALPVRCIGTARGGLVRRAPAKENNW